MDSFIFESYKGDEVKKDFISLSEKDLEMIREMRNYYEQFISEQVGVCKRTMNKALSSGMATQDTYSKLIEAYHKYKGDAL